MTSAISSMSMIYNLRGGRILPGVRGLRPARGFISSPPHGMSNGSFNICKLSRRHLASIALAVGIMTLLLIIFAYHGGRGVGSWFYSLLVVLSGLAFVVFGPLLLCRFLVHAYYRQTVQAARNAPANFPGTRRDVEAQTCSDGILAESIFDARRLQRHPQLYAACIIITPDDIQSSPRYSELPSYEEALSSSAVVNDEADEAKLKQWLANSNQNANKSEEREQNQTASEETGTVVDDKDDTPPPSYHDVVGSTSTAVVDDAAMRDISFSLTSQQHQDDRLCYDVSNIVCTSDQAQSAREHCTNDDDDDDANPVTTRTLSVEVDSAFAQNQQQHQITEDDDKDTFNSTRV